MPTHLTPSAPLNLTFARLALALASILLGLWPPLASAQEKPASLSSGKDVLGEAGFRRHAVTVNDATISYVLRTSTAAGPTLVLVPGSFDGAESWLAVAAKLDPAWQIMVVEMRGHGESWPPPTPETGTIEQFARDVFAATEHAGIRSFYVGGHSVGGMVAIECARQQPNLLRGVVSMEGWTRAQVLGVAFKGRTDNTLSDAQKKRKFELRRPTTSRWTKEQLSAFARIWEKWDGTEILEQTGVPVIEIWGDRGDEARPSRAVLRIPDRPNIDLVWVKGASHFLPLERPEETAAAINLFIRKVEGQRPR